MTGEDTRFFIFEKNYKSPQGNFGSNIYFSCIILEENMQLYIEFNGQNLLKFNGACQSDSLKWFGDGFQIRIQLPDFSGTYELKILVFNSTLGISAEQPLLDELVLNEQLFNSIYGKKYSLDNFIFLQFIKSKFSTQDESFTFNNFLETFLKNWEKAIGWYHLRPITNRVIDEPLWDYIWFLHRLNQVDITPIMSIEQISLFNELISNCGFKFENNKLNQLSKNNTNGQKTPLLELPCNCFLKNIDDYTSPNNKSKNYLNANHKDHLNANHKDNNYFNYYNKVFQNYLAPIEIIQCIEDLIWYREDLSKLYIISLLSCIYDSETGMFKGLLNYSDMYNINIKSQILSTTIRPFYPSDLIPTEAESLCNPPIISSTILQLGKYTGDIEFLKTVYPILKHNLKWWEKTHYNKDYELFMSVGTPDKLGWETQMFESPRFSQQFIDRKWISVDKNNERKLLSVDLNAQMCDFYQNMGIIGMYASDPESSFYFQKATQLQESAEELLWDPETKFYYDYDLDADSLQPIKTINGFWPLFGGLASKGHLEGLSKHLVNHNEFWSELPIPTVSMDEPFFKRAPWNGSVVLSQNYWIIQGLKRYNLNLFSTLLTKKTFDYLNNFYNLYNLLYAHYPAMSYNAKSIKSLHGPFINRTNALGYVPIHALFFQGVLGGEILDESINFVPDWDVIKKEINFKFYYRGKAREGYLSKWDKPIIEFGK